MNLSGVNYVSKINLRCNIMYSLICSIMFMYQMKVKTIYTENVIFAFSVHSRVTMGGGIF